MELMDVVTMLNEKQTIYQILRNEAVSDDRVDAFDLDWQSAAIEGKSIFGMDDDDENSEAFLLFFTGFVAGKYKQKADDCEFRLENTSPFASSAELSALLSTAPNNAPSRAWLYQHINNMEKAS